MSNASDLFGALASAVAPSKARAKRYSRILSARRESRAQALGVSPKSMVARTRRTLKSVRGQLEPLAHQWIDIDSSVQGALDELLAEFDRFSKHVEESAAWLNDEIGS